MAKRLAVVVSQSQSQHPAKRQLEEDIVAALLFEPGIDVAIIPHLYDLKPDSTGLLALSGMSGNLVVLSWLFERAARWTLDRHGIRGRIGLSLLKEAASGDDDDDEHDDLESEDGSTSGDAAASEKTRVADQRDLPARSLYCLDLRLHTTAEPYITEIKRIAREQATTVVSLGLDHWITGAPTPASLARYATPANDTALGPPAAAPVVRIEGEPDRRWYPVIDYSRCTNCMECIDFCLFGVYGVDRAETILVEQPDNCRKGCPACSRVCPENAIIFPQHKTPSIAGSELVAAGGLKIDLSKLFGAPDTGETAAEAAIRERDEQLLAAGRVAVGTSLGVPPSLARSTSTATERDELDDLIDRLDELDV